MDPTADADHAGDSSPAFSFCLGTIALGGGLRFWVAGGLPEGSSPDRAGLSAIGRTLAAGEVVKERPVELPRVEFIDRRLRVGQRAAGDAHEVDRTVQVVPLRRAAHVEVGVVGQRDVCAEAGPAGVLLAVDVDREGPRLAVGLGDDVVPLAVVDSADGWPGSPWRRPPAPPGSRLPPR